MKRVCVFCGSNAGVQPEYRQAAQEFGQVLAARGLGLVYGGSNVGLMGEVSKAVLEAGGDVVGVITEAFVRQDLAYRSLKDLRVVGTMHDRKALMAELADGFVALPGGLGTLEE